jgi:hypothetical protein
MLLAEYINVKRLLDRGYDDKGHHVFFDIGRNIRCHADFRGGSGLLFQHYYISATKSCRVLCAAIRSLTANVFDRIPRATGGD